MNSLIIAFILILWLILGYKIYGSFIEKKVVQADNSRLTPARELRDGIDYTPAKNLFFLVIISPRLREQDLSWDLCLESCISAGSALFFG